MVQFLYEQENKTTDKVPLCNALRTIISCAIHRSESQTYLRPSAFSRDISDLSDAKRAAIRSAYYRALKEQLVKLDDQGLPHLTEKGLHKIDL